MVVKLIQQLKLTNLAMAKMISICKCGIKIDCHILQKNSAASIKSAFNLFRDYQNKQYKFIGCKFSTTENMSIHFKERCISFLRLHDKQPQNLRQHSFIQLVILWSSYLGLDQAHIISAGLQSYVQRLSVGWGQ